MSDSSEIFPTPVRTSKTSLGKFGEKLAREYLRKKKYNVVDHNFRCPLGEIDIVVRINKAYRFVEVKYRERVSASDFEWFGRIRSKGERLIVVTKQISNEGKLITMVPAPVFLIQLGNNPA